ncbi:hypothetical protein BU14_0056s0010 [Porphyra umbilicalis]|uniref:Uncharacterized protein n=1 Tax=Porphyra umbilicalis TaxID=2786 RepID=A0A1X6PHB4_PORUM|nr:hypothetical protein BU14_0056s0010 [Porphyra umbilicalis]|eukprot:OSX80227.1 hypothetical protein BU14_0056s0010 [Porphyra umbilicalis]
MPPPLTARGARRTGRRRRRSLSLGRRHPRRSALSPPPCRRVRRPCVGAPRGARVHTGACSTGRRGAADARVVPRRRSRRSWRCRGGGRGGAPAAVAAALRARSGCLRAAQRGGGGGDPPQTWWVHAPDEPRSFRCEALMGSSLACGHRILYLYSS